jgi:hypothetical protein
MVSKNQKNLIKFIVLLLIALNFRGFLGTIVGGDDFQIYDDFYTGFRDDLWETYEHTKADNCNANACGFNPIEGCAFKKGWFDCNNGVASYNKKEIEEYLWELECEENTCGGASVGFDDPIVEAGGTYSEGGFSFYMPYTEEAPRQLGVACLQDCPPPPPPVKVPLQCEKFGGQVTSYYGTTGSNKANCAAHEQEQMCQQCYGFDGNIGANPCGTGCFICSCLFGENFCTTGSTTSYGECGGYKQDTCKQPSLIRHEDTRDLGVITVTTGNMNLLAERTLAGAYNYCAGKITKAEAKTTKKFDNEDIKITYTNAQGETTGSLKYGDTSIPLSSVPNSIIEIRRSDDFDLTQYDVYSNGQFLMEGNNPNPSSLEFKGRMTIHSVKYKPYYSCAIDYETEVVVRDRYNAGQTIDINDLTYTPKKFCPTDLGVLIITEQGLTDEKGSITQALAQGETITIETDCGAQTNCVDAEYIQVDYISNYVTGMSEKCGLGQVYEVTDNNTGDGKCVQVAGQAISTNELLYCKADSDCKIPAKCEDTTVECVNSTCDYESATCSQDQIINDLLTEATTILDEPQINVLDDGITKVTFTTPQDLIGTDFAVSGREHIFGNDDCYRPEDPVTGEPTWGYIPASTEGCYAINVNWGGYSFSIENGETKVLDEHVSVKYRLSGRGAYYGEKDCATVGEGEDEVTSCIFYDYEFRPKDSNSNIFEVTLTNLFELEDVEYDSYVKLNDDKHITLTLKNNIKVDADGGFNTRLSTGLRDIFYDTLDIQETFTASTSKEYELNIDTTELGVNNFEIIPYINILGTQKYRRMSLDIPYIVNQDGSEGKDVTINIDFDPEDFQDDKPKKITAEKSLFTNEEGEPNILAILSVGAAVIYFMQGGGKKPRKRKR